VPYNQTNSLLKNHLNFNKFKSLTSAGSCCKQPDHIQIKQKTYIYLYTVNNKKKRITRTWSQSRNAKFCFKRDFRPDPHGVTVFYSRHFCAELHGLSFKKSRSRSHRCVLCEKSDFSQFLPVFDSGADCRPRQDIGLRIRHL
jgi:hypothetical protein